MESKVCIGFWAILVHHVLCIVSRTTDTQWRHESKKSENLGRCGRQNILRPYLKIWYWEWIFGRAVKTISSPGVRSRYVVSLCCQYVSGFRQICAHGQIMFNKFNYSHYLIFSYQHSLSSQITCFPPSLLLSSWKIPPLSTFHSLASLGTKCHISLASNIFACTHIMHWIKIVYRVYH